VCLSIQVEYHPAYHELVKLGVEAGACVALWGKQAANNVTPATEGSQVNGPHVDASMRRVMIQTDV
jgi:hypothetical protein